MTSELLEIICLLPVRSIGQPCPTCRGPLQRSWNRPSDRVVSKFLLVQRFACRGQDCRWEGLLRVDIAPDGIVAGLRADAPTVSGTPIASMARKVIARWLFPDAGT